MHFNLLIPPRQKSLYIFIRHVKGCYPFHKIYLFLINTGFSIYFPVLKQVFHINFLIDIKNHYFILIKCRTTEQLIIN